MARIEGKLGAADPIMPTEQRVSMTTNAEPLRRSDLSTEAKTVMAVGVPCMQAPGQALSQRMYRYRIFNMQPPPTDIPPDYYPLLHKQQKQENDQPLPRPAILVHESSPIKKPPKKAPKDFSTLSLEIAAEYLHQLDK